MTTGVSPRALVPPPPVRCVPSEPARLSERKSPLLLFPFPLLIGTRRRDPPFGTLSPFRLRGRRGPDIFTGRTRYTHTLPRAAEEDLPRKRWCGQQESPPPPGSFSSAPPATVQRWKSLSRRSGLEVTGRSIHLSFVIVPPKNRGGNGSTDELPPSDRSPPRFCLSVPAQEPGQQSQVQVRSAPSPGEAREEEEGQGELEHLERGRRPASSASAVFGT